MNIKQKIYDSNDSGNTRIKIKNSSALYKNLEEIRNRKNIYIYSSPSPRKKTNKISLLDYETKRENSLIQKLIRDIRTREVKPILNTEQNEIVNNSMNSKKKHYKLINLALKKENQSFKKRIFNQKPFISVKDLDKEYNDMVNKNKAKRKANKSLVLPPIISHKQ